jgi:basic membrane lipoprotein Med (substrate-binding protein (PBP1-ABC) superfamily)/DNA-binding SARP family transcriptional activator
LQFRILGPLSVVGDGRVAALGPPKQRALLAILLTRIGEVVTVERLIELLWGEAAPRTADHSVQIYISDLRRAFEPLGGSDRLVTRHSGYVLEVDPDSVDAWRFERLVREGMRLLEDGDQDAGRSTIREALGLWSGPPLSDFPYEEFAQPVARRLTEGRLTAVEAYAAASLEAGRITEALDLLTTAVQEDPLRERARELLMLALYRSGRHADALRSFHALRTQLTDEFGVDPSPSIRALYDRILAHDPSLGKGLLAAANVRVTLACEGAGVGGDRLGVERGFDRAVSDFSLVPRKENVELSASYQDLSAVLRDLSEQAPALIVCLNFLTIDAIAHEHPGTQYLVFDHVGAAENVSYVHFHEREAAFLAGTAAALTSQTGVVGFIGGWDQIPIWGFLAGFEAGVRATNAGIRILAAYAGEWPEPQGFVDLDRNEELARQMFTDGADVIVAASGPAGMGVVSAAAVLSGSLDRHLWVIGVDTDWYEDLSRNLGIISPRVWRSHVLTSVRKRFDLAVYEALQAVASGDRPPPVKAYGLRSGLVDISYEGGYLDNVRPLIEDQRRRIVSGQLRVPCLPSDHVSVASAHLEQIGLTLDEWLEQGCPPWRTLTGDAFERRAGAASS